MIETAKGYFTVKVTEYNCRLKKLAYEDDEPPRRLIGFARDNTEEDEEDDDDI